MISSDLKVLRKVLRRLRVTFPDTHFSFKSEDKHFYYINVNSLEIMVQDKFNRKSRIIKYIHARKLKKFIIFCYSK